MYHIFTSFSLGVCVRPDFSRCHHSNNKSVFKKQIGNKITVGHLHQARNTLTMAHPNHMLFNYPHPSLLSPYNLQGEWNSVAGRGVQCVVSKFRMYFRALERERQQGWRRNGE